MKTDITVFKDGKSILENKSVEFTNESDYFEHKEKFSTKILDMDSSGQIDEKWLKFLQEIYKLVEEKQEYSLDIAYDKFYKKNYIIETISFGNSSEF